MAADAYKIDVQSLRYDRQRLSELVFEPLQEIKDFVARNLRLDEVDNIVGFLGNVIRSDTLKTVTDGEALIAVLNLYYGKDNLRVLQRLLKKINCNDLLQVLNEWEASNNPVDPRVFQECGYFPLWIRIKNHFTWFSENKKTILQTIKRLFRVPEIASGDPDYETVIFMGVSFGKTDILVYVLVPLCVRKHIRTSLGRNDVCLALEQLSISGVYFGRKSGKNGYGDDLSITSFSSINESMQGDFVDHAQDRHSLHPPMVAVESRKNGLYNGVHTQNEEFLHNPDSTQSVSHSGSRQGKAKEDLKVVRASMGYIKSVPPENKADQPIRVVRPKILYINHNVAPAMDVEDAAVNERAVFDVEQHQSIVKESNDMVQKSPHSYKEEALNEKSNAALNLQYEKRERIPADELEGLIVPEVKHRRDKDWELPDEIMHAASQEHSDHGVNWSYSKKRTDYEGSKIDKRQTSVLDFSVEDNNERGWQPQSSRQKSPIGTAEPEVVVGSSSTRPKLIPVERSTSKSVGKKLYTSTATFQVNMGNKTANSQAQPMGYAKEEIFKPETMASLNMNQSGFDNQKLSAKGSTSLPRQAENGYSSWYEDAAVEDYYKQMIPEPEPGDTQQLYWHEEFFQQKMIPEEEIVTPTNPTAKNIHGSVHTPLYTPPTAFRDATPAGGKLVKVKTGLVDTPKQQPSIVSTNHDNTTQNGWERSRVESDKFRQFPKTVALPSDGFDNRSANYGSTEYSQHHYARPDPVSGYSQQHLTVTKAESELLSDYEDSVFTDHDDTGSRFAVVPPPYVPPPDYKKAPGSRRSDEKFSDDSDTFDRDYKSRLLSAASVSSIYKEKEKFLSQEELQMSIRGAEDKEIEKQMELCKDLMIAAKAGDDEEAKRLIEEGVDVNHQNEFGQSAMMVASWEGHLGIVEALISAEADPNLQDGFGKSALHEAAVSGQHAIVHRLIPGGANVNLADEEHRTPLHYAAMRGKRRIVEVLLLFGANVSLLTKNGESAIELAFWYRHDDIVTLLMSHGDKKTRKEMEGQIRKQKLRQISSAASLPNLSKATSMKELSRSRSRPDLRKKKSVCSIQ
ncbi:hypothetical protein ACROYT_G003791 [Oculina patagonica]